MSKKNKKRFDTIETWIGLDTVFTGDIVSDKIVRIDGKLYGDIKKSEGVIVGDSAEIKGDINTKYIIVSGIIEGNIIANDGIELLNKSKVIGDIQTSILSIGEGAFFDGKSSMSKTEKDKLDNEEEKL
ncbi:MAG: polymer-forming cytoskeletal protein [Endomicrobiia bacterium]|jgi:cytoskeletal protein CcmA (bactofilin family)|nr:polymer-forming cytoskeletal protein [Endomicrobiaceae bacterium]MDD3053226.1 polymer-forming cytoskeletal protein [Endomicrobiaceae bacterium]MDD3923118.1 polymer-forming cytoskeletal protein [Endomicrobiaceae bacterium]MDD5101927.1 polymer-forming cytoskeletal protein [Endomicrobiaceae bacterium]